jgi:hypothetical protein
VTDPHPDKLRAFGGFKNHSNTWGFFVSTSQQSRQSFRHHDDSDSHDQPSPLADSPWLNAEQAGEYLGGYSAWSIRKFAKQKLIKHTRAPGQNTGYRFKREWLDEFLESRAIPAKTARGRRVPVVTAPAVKTQPPRQTIPMDPGLAAAVERARARMAKQAASK